MLKANSIEPKVWFEVRLQFYQYNSGRGDNGFVAGKRKFNSVANAESYIKDVQRIYQNRDTEFGSEKYQQFVDEYLSYSGYLKEIIGIWKVTYSEEKIN